MLEYLYRDLRPLEIMSFVYQVISEIIRRFTILLIFVFLSVFFFVVGLAVWIFFRGAGEITQREPVFVPNADISKVLENWSLYRNHEIGFEIMHPRSTAITSRNEGEADQVRFIFPLLYSGIFTRKYLEMTIGDESLGFCQERLINLGRENIRIGDLEFRREFELRGNGGRESDFTRYYTTKDGVCYKFEFVIDFKEAVPSGYDPAADIFRRREAEVFNIIISTFGFAGTVEKSSEPKSETEDSQ